MITKPLEEEEQYNHQIKIPLQNGMNCIIPIKLCQELDILLDNMIHSQMDAVFVIDGKEGCGKSRTGRILGKYCAYRLGSEFGPKNIYFNSNDYINASENGHKWQINLLDESREALNKKRSMSASNVKFTNWLSENRNKYQVHILILPAIHDLDNYITMWRMSLLIHHYLMYKKNKDRRSGYELVRGYFKVFAKNKDLQRVIFNKSKFGYYAYPHQPKFVRKFGDFEVFTEKELQEYEDRKNIKRSEKYKEMEKKKENPMVKHIERMRGLGYTKSSIAECFGVSRKTIENWVNANKI